MPICVQKKKMLKKEVLRNKNDFSNIYNRGKSQGERFVVVFYRKNSLLFNRTAFLASKKVGNAVERNRARRLMKEICRGLKDKLLQGYDIIFIARSTIKGRKCADVKKSIEAALSKAKLIDREKNIQG